jgi:hypothetical protein
MTELECGSTTCTYNRQGRCTARNARISNEGEGITCLTYEQRDSGEMLGESMDSGGVPVPSGGPTSTGMPSSGPSGPPSGPEGPDDLPDDFLALMGMG